MNIDHATIGYLEDDPVIRENYVDLLESDGYTVIPFDNKAEAEPAFIKGNIDLALLDVELAEDKLGGMELCKSLRKQCPDIPIIFLTSHSHIDMQSKGWRLGADDYVTKDTELELVLLRIKALLKRYSALKQQFTATHSDTISLDIHIDELGYKAYWKGQLLDLSLTQFWLLSALVKNEGAAINHEQLQSAANIYVETNTIVSHIKGIRDVFKKADPSFNAIKTERGKGYRWVIS